MKFVLNTYWIARFAGAALTCFSGLLYAVAGQLDPTFGDDGKVLTPFPICQFFCGASANAAALQSDGKIVVAGTINTQTGNGLESVLVRYTTNGRLDGSFGTGGMAKLPSSTPGGGFSAVAIQTDGKIVAATAQVEKGFIAARFLSNGSLDTSFGSGGLVIFGRRDVFPPVAEALTLQPDEKILVSYGALTRLNTDGSLDTTFGSGGTAATVGAVSVALQSDGKILVAGATLSRYHSNGTLDTTFGIAGIGGSPASFASVAFEGSTARIVAAGSFATQPAPSGPQLIELAVLRYTDIGVPDATFGLGGGGFAPPFSSGLLSSAAALAVQPNGSIVVAGQTAVVGAGGGSSNAKFEVARFTSTGQLDSTFGAGGQVITSFGGSNEFAAAVLRQPDGKIVAVGNSVTVINSSTSASSFALARYLGQ
jgi:uncharacterized delta-60 repeat protein